MKPKFMLSKPRDRALSAEDLALVAHIARGYPGLSVAQIAKMVAALVPLAAESAAYAKTGCDRDMTPEEKANDAEVDAAIIEAVQALGIMIEFGDPRGYTVQLRINAPPNGFRPHNNMGGETWGVRLAAARARWGFRAFGGMRNHYGVAFGRDGLSWGPDRTEALFTVFLSHGATNEALAQGYGHAAIVMCETEQEAREIAKRGLMFAPVDTASKARLWAWQLGGFCGDAPPVEK